MTSCLQNHASSRDLWIIPLFYPYRYYKTKEKVKRLGYVLCGYLYILSVFQYYIFIILTLTFTANVYWKQHFYVNFHQINKILKMPYKTPIVCLKCEATESPLWTNAENLGVICLNCVNEAKKDVDEDTEVKVSNQLTTKSAHISSLN